jgi:nucleoid-associated protein EbfC
MFGKIAEAQQKAEEVKQRLENITVEGSAANGKVKVVLTANKNIKQIHIDDDLLSPTSKVVLEESIIAALQHAMSNAEAVSAAEMKHLMSSMLPGGLGNLFSK